MKKLFMLILISLVLATLFTSCEKDKDDTDDNVTIFKSMLFGASEVPSNPSSATGSATLTYDETTKRFTVVTNYTGLNPTAGHIHNAPTAVNGPVVFPFVITPSPISYQSGVLTEEQIDELFGGRMYVNLHTAAYPGGEIRGQLMKQ